MKVGTITTPNVKGQIVIPKKMRDVLGIDANMPLKISLRGNGIYIHPIKGVVTEEEKETSFVEILKKTQGTLVGENWEKIRKKRREIELAASRRRKKTW